MILNGNTFNSIALNGGSNSIIVLNNAGGNNNGGSGNPTDPILELLLNDFGCPINTVGLTSNFYLGNYNIDEQSLVNNRQVFVINKKENHIFSPITYNNLGRNGIGTNSDKIRGKTISLDIYIGAKTKTEFYDKYDEVMGELTKEYNCLVEKINGEYRKIRVIPQGDPTIHNNYNNTFIKMTMTFLAIDPYWSAVNGTTGNITITDNHLLNLVNLGVKETYGVMKINVNSASGVNNLKITINEGENISYNKSISAGDTFEIDYRTGILKKNDEIRGYDGTMTYLNKGNNTLLIESNGTFSYDIEYTYYKTFA